jgi:hypothetical protein
MATELAKLNSARTDAVKLEDLIRYLNEKYVDFPEYALELSAPYVERLKEVRTLIDELVGVSPLADSDIVLHIRTREDSEGGPRASLIVDSIANFRTALTRITMQLTGNPRPGLGRLPEKLRKATDFRIVGLASGSVRIGVKLERSVSQAVLTDEEPVKSLEHEVWTALELLQTAAASLGGEGPTESLNLLIPDRDLRGAVLREVARISPGDRGRVISISLDGGAAISTIPVMITAETGRRALGTLFPGSDAEPFDDVGTLRAIEVDRDLPKHQFILRNRPENRPDVEGDFNETLRFAVMDAVDKAHAVRVRGILEKPRGLKGKPLVHIESIELA